MKTAVIKTGRGTIKCELFDKEAPKTVANFEKLAKEGFYNGQRFHRVVPNFVIQGGDPQSKDDKLKARWGTGGPGYTTECELVPARKHGRGTLSMAHAGGCQHDKTTGKKLSGACSNGSQFFITHRATPHLDMLHTVFGQVLEGQEIVDAIQPGDKIEAITVG
ncbi:MAG: peptidylprolyl isomerase [Planctomycetes bacterium]|nr:peptidylprolyl isomerase [Planctomycetota bacterium]